MKPTRREFLAGSAGAGLSLPFLGGSLAPRWLQGLGGAGEVLVVVNIRGGNDMLQTINNPSDATLAKARPTLHLPQAKMIQLQTNSSFYLHPMLKGFKALHDRGDIAWIPGVGYPNPNLSHFRSEDIWSAADPTATTVPSGWMARHFNLTYTGTAPIPAMNFDSRKADAFVGYSLPVFRSASQFRFLFDPGTPQDDTVEAALLKANAQVLRPTASPNLKFITSALAQTITDQDTIQKTNPGYTPKVTYPNPSNSSATASLIRNLQLAARYITGGLPTQVYWTSTGGYDLHANMAIQNAPETGAQANLLQRLSDTVTAFLDDIKAHGFGSKVVVFIWSEFGRRLGENGNLGVDHGWAGLSLVAGAPVTGGVYGSYPDLAKAAGTRTDYHRINVPHTTDFRSVYATLLAKWLKVDPKVVLGGSFPLLGFLP
ncbi:MAG: DUF1501 domain-containing protein [Planctomycetota bacterium]